MRSAPRFQLITLPPVSVRKWRNPLYRFRRPGGTGPPPEKRICRYRIVPSSLLDLLLLYAVWRRSLYAFGFSFRYDFVDRGRSRRSAPTKTPVDLYNWFTPAA